MSNTNGEQPQEEKKEDKKSSHEIEMISTSYGISDLCRSMIDLILCSPVYSLFPPEDKFKLGEVADAAEKYHDMVFEMSEVIRYPSLVFDSKVLNNLCNIMFEGSGTGFQGVNHCAIFDRYRQKYNSDIILKINGSGDEIKEYFINLSFIFSMFDRCVKDVLDTDITTTSISRKKTISGNLIFYLVKFVYCNGFHKYTLNTGGNISKPGLDESKINVLKKKILAVKQVYGLNDSTGFMEQQIDKAEFGANIKSMLNLTSGFVPEGKRGEMNSLTDGMSPVLDSAINGIQDGKSLNEIMADVVANGGELITKLNKENEEKKTFSSRKNKKPSPTPQDNGVEVVEMSTNEESEKSDATSDDGEKNEKEYSMPKPSPIVEKTTTRDRKDVKTKPSPSSSSPPSSSSKKGTRRRIVTDI